MNLLSYIQKPLKILYIENKFVHGKQIFEVYHSFKKSHRTQQSLVTMLEKWKILLIKKNIFLLYLWTYHKPLIQSVKKSQLRYCRLTWIFFSRKSNDLISNINERSLRLI